MRKNIVKEKSYGFALRMLKAYRYLTQEQREFVLTKQVLRSGTAIGALVRETEYAESTTDFAHKLRIARKEANETGYWLSLLKDTDCITQKMYTSIFRDNEELLKLLTASIKTITIKTNK